VLTYSSEALFGTKLCGLLVSLEVASPRYGKNIACVLARKSSKDMIRIGGGGGGGDPGEVI
jgi:hypothetical protein